MQEILHILCNPEVHDRVHKLRPLVHIMSQIITSPSHPISLICISILSSHARLDFPNGPLPLGFPRKRLCISVLPNLLFCNMLTFLR